MEDQLGTLAVRKKKQQRIHGSYAGEGCVAKYPTILNWTIANGTRSISPA